MLKANQPVNINENLAGEYIARINKVIDYIEKNLAKELTVEELASVANFSRFHFHRIFGSIVGEPLNKFVQRIRLEKAALLLMLNTKTPVTEIAFDCGFSGAATFSRAFKEYYNTSPSEWRSSNSGKQESKDCKQVRNLGKEFEVTSQYVYTVPFKHIWRVKMNNTKLETEVRVEETPAFTVAYVRHIGPYKGNEKLFESLWGKICGWAGPRDLLKADTKFLTIYHDNPDITDENNLRISVCISVPEDTVVEGEIGKMNIPAGKNAIGKFEIFPDQYPQAWDSMYAGWLPQSGYQPDDRPCYEFFLMDPKNHPEGKHVFEIYVPVKPL